MKGGDQFPLSLYFVSVNWLLASEQEIMSIPMILCVSKVCRRAAIQPLETVGTKLTLCLLPLAGRLLRGTTVHVNKCSPVILITNNIKQNRVRWNFNYFSVWRMKMSVNHFVPETSQQLLVRLWLNLVQMFRFWSDSGSESESFFQVKLWV